MSTTDTRAAFEYWFSDEGAHPKAIERSSNGGYILAAATSAWNVWQAATEAAKATGTAGEQSTLIGMEVSMDVSTGDEDFDHRIFGRIEGLMAKGDGTDIILAVEESRNFATDTQAARQPAPVDYAILHEWADVKGVSYNELCTVVRAALAATAAPVLSDEQIDHIARSYFSDPYDQGKVAGIIHDAFLEARVADSRTLREAERYRYLRSVVYPEKFYASGHPSWVIRYHLRGETFDSAVDHAIIAATNRSQPCSS